MEKLLEYGKFNFKQFLFHHSWTLGIEQDTWQIVEAFKYTLTGFLQRIYIPL